MKLYKAISFMCILGCVSNVGYGAQMTPQIQRLMEEKEKKLAELEKCDSKRKGFMIAGISTLGLTAVGIGGNIALANKNKKLNTELDAQKQSLAEQQSTLSDLNKQIEDKKREEQQAQKPVIESTSTDPVQMQQEKDAQDTAKLFMDYVHRLTTNQKGLKPYSWTKEMFCNQIKQSDPKVGFTIDQVDINKTPDNQAAVQSVLGFVYMCKQSGQGSRFVSHKKSNESFYAECIIGDNNTFCDEYSSQNLKLFGGGACNSNNSFPVGKYMLASVFDNNDSNAAWVKAGVISISQTRCYATAESQLDTDCYCVQAKPYPQAGSIPAVFDILETGCDVDKGLEKRGNACKCIKGTFDENQARCIESEKGGIPAVTKSEFIDWWCSSLSTASTTLSSQKEVGRKMGFVADGKNCFCSALMTSGVTFEHWTKQQEYTTKDECAQKCKGACGL